MKLQEILQQPNGFAPPVIDVKIESIGERKSGTGQFGDWSFQNVDVSDGTGKYKLSLKNLPALDTNKVGAIARISCKHSEQHGLTGLRVQHTEKNGKKYSAIVVTASALWTFLSEQPQPHPQAQPQVQPKPQKFVDSESAAIEHLKACQQLAIELALMSKNAGAPSESIITGNQVVMFMRDQALWLGRQQEPQPEEQNQVFDINDEDIPF